MGAWNYGVFDDDTAYDALDDLIESSKIISDMEKYFDIVPLAVIPDIEALQELKEYKKAAGKEK